jgi:hypothetical protein
MIATLLIAGGALPLALLAGAVIWVPSSIGEAAAAACCRDQRDGRIDPSPNSVSHYTDGLRAPELQHPVQDIHSNGRFGHLTRMRTRAEGITDHPLVPADRPFRQGAPIVAAVLLPAHTAALGDLLQMPITLRRRGVRGLARHGGCAWRYNNRGLRMTFGNRIVDIVPVVGPITSKRVIGPAT